MKKLIMLMFLMACVAPAFGEYYDEGMPDWAGGGSLANGSSCAVNYSFPGSVPEEYCYTASDGDNEPTYEGPWFGFHQDIGNAGAFSGDSFFTVTVSDDAVYLALPSDEQAAHVTVRAQIVYKGDCIGVAFGAWEAYTTPTGGGTAGGTETETTAVNEAEDFVDEIVLGDGWKHLTVEHTFEDLIFDTDATHVRVVIDQAGGGCGGPVEIDNILIDATIRRDDWNAYDWPETPGYCFEFNFDKLPNPIIISPNVMTVYETGETEGDFGISLLNEPPAGTTVTITVDPNNGGPSEDITLIGGDPCDGSITFDVNDSNWDEPQMVTFKAIDDDVAEYPDMEEQQMILVSSVYPANPEDANFVGEKSTTVTVVDNDQADILFTVTSPIQLQEEPIGEDGGEPIYKEVTFGVVLQVEPVNDEDPCSPGYVKIIVANEGESGNQPIMDPDLDQDGANVLPGDPNAIVFTSDGNPVPGVIGAVTKWDVPYDIKVRGSDDDVRQIWEAETDGDQYYQAWIVFWVQATTDEHYAPLDDENEPEGLEQAIEVDIEDNECGAFGISYLDVGNPNAATDPNYRDEDGNPLPDCYVDIYDVIYVATKWFDCTDPQDPSCWE